MASLPVLLVDLDGTITDSLPGIAASLDYALAEVGYTGADSRTIMGIAGPPMTETLRSLGLTDEQVEDGMAAYRRFYDERGWLDNEVYPGVAEVLHRLADRGYSMAVATSKAQESARRILEHFGLAEVFTFIGGADVSVGRSAKPDVVAHSLRALGIDPVDADDGGVAGVMMIGDRIHDVEGAGRFAIPCCLVKWGYGSPEEQERARWVAADPDQLEEIIREW